MLLGPHSLLVLAVLLVGAGLYHRETVPTPGLTQAAAGVESPVSVAPQPVTPPVSVAPQAGVTTAPLPATLQAAIDQALTSGNPAPLGNSRLPRLGDLTPPQLEGVARRFAAWPAPRRAAAFAFLLVGTPYRNGPLGEEAPPDTDPLFATRPVDCATVNLVAMSLAHVPESGTPREAMRHANYRHGRIGYATRLHFTTDRLDVSPYNKDITRLIGGRATRSRVVTLNRRPNGTPWIPIEWRRTRRVWYIPIAEARNFAARWREGRLPEAVGVAFVSERMMAQGLDVIHESLLWQGQTLLHGSSSAGSVSTVDWNHYLDSQGSRIDGVVVFAYR